MNKSCARERKASTLKEIAMYVLKNDFQWVKVDFKQILAGDKKLEQGEKVDHDILSQLLLV